MAVSQATLYDHLSQIWYDCGWRPIKSPGGSSISSAVAVSAGYVPISIGTEIDGSLITPANRASLYAMRPTVGMVSRNGIIPISATLGTVWPIARCVEDLAK
jgi:amidase